MRVVAIDPAPAKESTTYSAEDGFESVPSSEMRQVLASLETPVLLCWDAPLTGPRLVEEAGSGDGDFSQRRLEFLRPKGDGLQDPERNLRAAVRRLSPLDDLAIRFSGFPGSVRGTRTSIVCRSISCRETHAKRAASRCRN